MLLAVASMAGSSLFALQGTPIVSTIDVRVDGALMNTWDYDADLNAVVFWEGAYPEYAETVDIHYLMSDGC